MYIILSFLIPAVKQRTEEEPIQSGDVSSTTPDIPPPQGGGEGGTEPVTDVGAVADRLQKELALSKPPHR